MKRLTKLEKQELAYAAYQSCMDKARSYPLWMADLFDNDTQNYHHRVKDYQN